MEVNGLKETTKIHLKVNGKDQTSEIEPRLLMSYYLRENLNLTGTHVGCDTSQCGACTVFVDGESAKSCTMLAVQADGTEITTVEGLGSMEKLHAIQRGFWEEHGLQCGFCTPGVMIAMAALLKENPNPTESEIREGMKGVICRCTGYQFIVKSVQHAANILNNEKIELESAGQSSYDGGVK